MFSTKAVLAFVAVAALGRLAGADELLTLDGGTFLFPLDFAATHAASPSAGTLPAAEGARPLRLAWLDPAEVAVRCGTGAREEAVRVFKAMGIPANWRRANAGELARAEEIRVILLDRGALNGRHAAVLGSTPTRFESTPFVWIHVPSVRRALGLPGSDRTLLELRDGYSLGVALGRVIAHEIVHALAPGVAHGEGLMASRLTRRDLTASSVPVTPEVISAVHNALAGVPDSPAPGAGLLAVEHAARQQPR